MKDICESIRWRIKHLEEYRDYKFGTAFVGANSVVKNNVRAHFKNNVDRAIVAELQKLDFYSREHNPMTFALMTCYFEGFGPELGGMDGSQGYTSFKVDLLDRYETYLRLNEVVAERLQVHVLERTYDSMYGKKVEAKNYILAKLRKNEVYSITEDELIKYIEEQARRTERHDRKLLAIHSILPLVVLNDNNFDDIHFEVRIALKAVWAYQTLIDEIQSRKLEFEGLAKVQE